MSLRCSYCKLVGVCLFLSILLVQVVSAQGSGTIKGRVLDKVTNDDLPGANVVVMNTSLGTAADLDGNFILHFVPVGKWTLKVSYIGYNAITEVVEITANATLEKNFFLTPTTLMGEEVVVTAQARGQAEAINQQLASNKIANMVSEARIQELPDFNAAQAISRLPGVSTLQSSGEADKIVIRGLAPQYNAVTIGGIQLASTGSTQVGVTSLGNTSGNISSDRSVDLAMVTPYMLKSVEVYKTITPDMEANVLGGSVNMDLREAPSGFRTDLLFQSGYTQKSNTYGNYRTVLSASDRFFKDKLGLYVLGNAEQYDRDADNMNAQYITGNALTIGANGYHPVTVQNVTLQRHTETRKRYGGNLVLDYSLPSGSIELVNMFSRLNSNYKDYQTTIDYEAHGLDFSYRAGNGNTDLALNSLDITNDFGFMSVDLKAANTYSRNFLPSSPRYDFVQNTAIPGPTPVNTVPDSLPHLVHYLGADKTFLTTINLFTTDYHEIDQTYKGDFKIPLNIKSSVSGFFKFGGAYRYNWHENNQNTPYIQPHRGGGPVNDSVITYMLRTNPGLVFDSSTSLFPAYNFTSTDSKLNGSFLDNQFGNMYWVVDPTILDRTTQGIANNPVLAGVNSAGNAGGWFNGPFQSLPNYYKYIEKYYGGYAMSELDLGPKFMVVGGARYEEIRSLFFAYNLVDSRDPFHQLYTPKTVYPWNHYWLPMVQAKYNPADWGDIRYSYTQTLARPDYHQITPHFTMDVSRSYVWAGNPDLVPAHSYNHDLLFTFHSNELGLLSIGGYYKEIKDFTYYTQYKLHTASQPGLDSVGSFNPAPNVGAILNTYINSPYLAFIKGVEFDFQTRFWYLRAPFNGVVLGINYTHIWSKATYPWRDDRTIYPRRPALPYVIVVDSSRVGRLIDQPNDIMNSYIGYDYKGFSARVSFLFQGNSVSYIGPFPEQDGFAKNFFRIDASVRQILPLWHLQLYLDINNINAEKNESAQQSIGGFTNEQYYGLTANLGLRYIL